MSIERGFLKSALRYGAYPAMTGGSIVFGLWAVNRGWPAWAVGVIAVAVATVLTALLEWIIPYSETWSRPHGDRFTDFWHLLLSNRAFDVGTLVAIGVFAPLGEWISSRYNVGLWPHRWPVLLQMVLALLMFELIWYSMHRWEHASPLLWRVHSVHHSSRRIYWWNFSRNHPFDNLASATAAMAPLALLGVGQAPLAVMAAFASAHGLLQHSNIDLRTGFLDLIFSTARVHRWHHSPLRHEADSNYSPHVMLWDHLFGTYLFKPDVAPPENVGLGPMNATFPKTYIEQCLIPFRREYWRKQKDA